jgi:tRNA(Ile)-lysidine synthetase, N-terminal domain
MHKSNYQPPATSPYSPPSRALHLLPLLLLPSNNNTTSKSNSSINSKTQHIMTTQSSTRPSILGNACKKGLLVILCMILRYWRQRDKKLLPTAHTAGGTRTGGMTMKKIFDLLWSTRQKEILLGRLEQCYKKLPLYHNRVCLLSFWNHPIFVKIMSSLQSQQSTMHDQHDDTSSGKDTSDGDDGTNNHGKNVHHDAKVNEIVVTDSLQHDDFIRDAHNYYNHSDSRDIHRVLLYWFGQNTPEKSQKQLWMIATSSVQHMEQIDADIAQQFLPLLVRLASDEHVRNVWMDKKKKKNNKNHKDDARRVDSWVPDSCGGCSCGWMGSVAAIVVLDQMSRHVHRYYKHNKLDSGELPLPKQSELDALALEIAIWFQKRYKDEIQCGMIPIPMMIFALMPLRHKSTIQSVGYVQSKVQDMALLHSVDLENMIRRFRCATNRRMAILQDEARREGKSTIYKMGEEEQEEQIGHENLDKVYPDIMETCPGEDSGGNADDDILEFHAFEADMRDASKTPVVKTMIQYLNDRGIRAITKSIKDDSTMENGTGHERTLRDTPVIVSLSGGVDSMVIANVLAYLRDVCGFSQLYIVAVHIDYGNRPESSAEASYVRHYALEILRLEQCIVRRIDEVTRGVTKRDEYEKFSRNVRYDLYRQTVEECVKICTKCNPMKQIEQVGVMLGHHRGDVVENVISNSNKGCGPLDLSGMTALSKNDGVTIYRPLLPLEKVQVYEYSHKFGVPYFKDTTPHWSTRGKLRNKLIPLLEEVYGDGCLSNLATLAKESDEARAMFNETALKPFMSNVQRFPMGIIFSTEEFLNQGEYFWKIVLRDLLHSVGLGMFSDKSTDSFLKRITPKKITSGEFQAMNGIRNVFPMVAVNFNVFHISSMCFLPI